jgi:hypothetical protein
MNAAAIRETNSKTPRAEPIPIPADAPALNPPALPLFWLLFPGILVLVDVTDVVRTEADGDRTVVAEVAIFVCVV